MDSKNGNGAVTTSEPATPTPKTSIVRKLRMMDLSKVDDRLQKNQRRLVTRTRERARLQTPRIPGINWQVVLGVNLRFGGYVWDPDIALRQDEEFYDRIERDAVAAHALYELRMLVAGNGYTITSRPGYEKLVPFGEAFCQDIDGFQESKQLLCHAPFRGTHAARIVSEMREGYKLTHLDNPRDWWCVNRLVDRDKRGIRIDYERIDESEPDSDVNRRYIYAVLDPIDQHWYVMRPCDYLIWAFNLTQASALFGHGLGVQTYIPVFVANQLFDIQLQSYDSYATGIKIAKVDPMVGLSPEGEDGEQDPSARLADIIEQGTTLGERGHTIGINAIDDLTVLWPQPGMFESLQTAIEYQHKLVRISILGSAVIAEGEGDGSRARSETQSRMGDRRVINLRAQLDTVTNRLLQIWWGANEHNWRDMGMWTERCPLRHQTNRWIDYDAKEESQTMLGLQQAGMVIPERIAHERTGIPMLRPGEKALDPMAQPGAAAPDSGNPANPAKPMKQKNRQWVEGDGGEPSGASEGTNNLAGTPFSREYDEPHRGLLGAIFSSMSRFFGRSPG